MEQLLTVYITVVEKENFTRAAEALHMTQPAVSQYIQTLERTMGTRLLERNNKQVVMNKAGEIVFHYAKEIMGSYSQMQKLVDDLMNKAGGRLAIGASYTFGEYILPHIVAFLKSRYPLIKPKITIANTTRISEWVAIRQLDIGIVDGEVKHKNLKVEPFAEDKMYVVVSHRHALADRSDVKVSDLQNETWIVREATSGSRQATEQLFTQLGFYPERIMEFGSTQIIKESVEAGLGISLLSHCTLQKDISFGTLKVLKLNFTPFFRKFSYVRQATPFSTKAAEVFIEILKRNEGFPAFFCNTWGCEQ